MISQTPVQPPALKETSASQDALCFAEGFSVLVPDLYVYLFSSSRIKAILHLLILSAVSDTHPASTYFA